MSGNPQKRAEAELNKLIQNEKKRIPAVLIITAIFAIAIIAVVTVFVFNYFSDDKLMDKLNYFDKENDVAVLTLPASLFQDGDIKEIAKTLKNSGGVTKVKINSDDSVTAIMTAERYEKFKDDSSNAVNALPIMLISEDTAIRNYESDDENTTINLTVVPDDEKLDAEVKDMLFIVRFYQIAMMNSDSEITVNYISYETNEVYLTEVYDLDGNKIK